MNFIILVVIRKKKKRINIGKHSKVILIAPAHVRRRLVFCKLNNIAVSFMGCKNRDCWLIQLVFLVS